MLGHMSHTGLCHTVGGSHQKGEDLDLLGASPCISGCQSPPPLSTNSFLPWYLSSSSLSTSHCIPEGVTLSLGSY